MYEMEIELFKVFGNLEKKLAGKKAKTTREVKIEAKDTKGLDLTLNLSIPEIRKKQFKKIKKMIEVIDGKDPEYGRYTVYEGITSEGLDELVIPVSDAGPYISDTKKVVGNKFSSDTDTYGSFYGTKAYDVYFLFIEEQECYSVIIREYSVF